MKKNLILVIDKRLDSADIHEIAQRVVRLDPGIAVHLVSPRETAEVVTGDKWERPSVTVGFGRTRNFAPPRGPIFESLPIPKLDQYERFRAAGIPTPRTARFEFGKRYDEGEWSEFVILKPLPLGLTSRRGWSRLYRTRRLEQVTARDLPQDHFLKKGPGLIQTLVDTGAHPWKWRILSLFGEALYSSITRSAVARVPLDASDEEIEASIIDAKNPKSTAADTEGKRNWLAADNDVLELAKRIHSVFPRIPVLGIDILKRESDGALFAIEVNAGGNVWHFSSGKNRHRDRLGGRQAMIDQFDAWTAAARALIRVTHANAT